VFEHTKIDAKPIFRSLEQMLKFSINSGVGENRRDIDFIVPKHQLVALRIVAEHHCGPAVQFGGQTLVRTFFWGKILCVHIWIS